MKKIFLGLFLVVLTGCASVAKLDKPTYQAYFVLDKDYTHTATRGLLKFKWVEGLRAGKYKLVGTDKEGQYFMGEGDCVIALSEERADKYLASGEITPFAERNKAQFTFAGGTGGLWLPKPGVNKPPRLFYEIRNTNDGANAGITGMTLVSLTEGELNYIPFDDQQAFIAALKIVQD